MNPSTENYLKTIFNIEAYTQAKIIKPTDIAKNLAVSSAAVTDMLKKLEEHGYISYKPYKGVALTEKGRLLGAQMVRRHRLWESYLAKVLGIPWDQVHDEAERLEHAGSDFLIDTLDKALGHPKYDQHGNPIPDKKGHLPKIPKETMLSLCKVGDSVEIARVANLDNQFLAYMKSHHLELNQKAKISEILGFDHSIILSVANTKISISHAAASQIFVRII